MSWKSGVENPMIIQKIVTHSNKKQLLMLSLSMLKTILLSIVWVMLKLRLFLKGGTSRNANQNEEHDIPDVDLDMDYDM